MADRAGSVLVPKGPRAKDGGIEELRRALFAMPLPPNPTRTRTYPTHTALGRVMRLRGLSINEVAKIPGGPSARQLGDALAERRALSTEHRRVIAAHYDFDARLLD